MSSSAGRPGFGLPAATYLGNSFDSALGGTLRNSQSFSKLDEGYSGEETQTPTLDDVKARDRLNEVQIPAWMTGLNDALREGNVCRLLCSHPPSYSELPSRASIDVHKNDNC
jgi:hypothetical protein